jgi:hypothetical protein
VAGTTVVSDGGQWFRCIAEQPGIVHQRHVTGSDRTAARHPAFRWANTMLANIKNSLLASLIHDGTELRLRISAKPLI